MGVSPLFYLILSLLFVNSFCVDQCERELDSLCLDSTCATPLFDPTIAKPCTCGENDIGAQYTACDATETSRQLVYFWRPPATCLGGVLPDPVDGIPCGLNCGAGTFLNVTTKECQSCEPGSFGLGGGHQWNDWYFWPGQFRTYCVIGGGSTVPCSSWRLLGELTDSGDNNNLNYLESILELRIQLVTRGTIGFHYRVSAEQNFDGLYFLVNNLALFFKSNVDWTYYTVDLDPGYYLLQWQYYKDRSITGGEDRAQLSSIRVTGTTFAEISCELCPKGHAQELPNSSDCKECSPGYYADVPGLTSCKPCPVGQTSYYAASSCFFQRSCDSPLDYSYSYSNCIDGQRTKTYKWIEPTSCNKDNVTLPPSEIESCTQEPCLPGQYLNQHTCSPCIAGTATQGQSVCSTCQAGTAADYRIVYFNKWDEFDHPNTPAVVSTGCKGDCFLQNGWRLGQWFTDSGTSNGPDSRSWLSISTLVYSGFTISFTYSLACLEGNYVTLTANEFVFTHFDCQLKNDSLDNCEIPSFTTYNRTFNIPSRFVDPTAPLNFTFTWTYYKTTPTTPSSCDRILIKDVTLAGIVDLSGGAATCDSCAAGTYSTTSAYACQSCDVGSFSKGNAARCTECPDGFFADQTGYGECLPCGKLGIVNAEKSYCDLECDTYSLTDAQNRTYYYNLTEFKEFQLTHLYSDNGTAILYNLYGSLCGWSQKCLNNREGGLLNALACVTSDDSNQVINLGKTMTSKNYEGSFYSIIPSGPDQGITFNMNNGDAGCVLKLNLKCEPNAGVGTASPISAADWEIYTNTCKYEVFWRTSYACPLCAQEDIVSYITECVDGVEQKIYFWNNTNCFGGVSLPPNESSSCQSVIKVKSSAVIIIVVISLIVLAIAAGFIIYLYRKNRKLYSDYQQLKGNNIPLEIENE